MSEQAEDTQWPLDSSRHRARAFLIVGLVVEGGMGIAAWLIGRATGVDTLHFRRWAYTDVLLGIAATLPMFPLFAACLRSSWAPLEEIRRFLEDQLRPALACSRWYELALLAASAGLGEEICFRGLIQQAIARSWGAPAAVILASLLFGFAHPITRAYVAVAGLLGIYLGAIYATTGSLLTVSVAHGFYDLVALVWFVNMPPSQPEAETARENVAIPETPASECSSAEFSTDGDRASHHDEVAH